MTIRTGLALVRFTTATVVLVAIGTQLAYGLQINGSFSIINFFSFFTILSNFLAAVLFLMSAVVLMSRIDSRALDMWRGAVVLYMLMTGIIYVVLLSNADVQTPIPWVNSVLHYIFPVVVLADWLLDRPKSTIHIKQSLLWLLFPLAYVAYSLVRGPFANHWYPYPFIDVQQLGYVQVLFNCALLSLVAAALALVVAKLPRIVGNRRFIS